MKLSDFDWRRWTYKGVAMHKPHVILWKAFWYVPLVLCLCFTCLFAGIGFGLDASKEIWKTMF